MRKSRVSPRPSGWYLSGSFRMRHLRDNYRMLYNKAVSRHHTHQKFTNMNTIPPTRLFLQMVCGQLPTFIICVVACILILAKWKQAFPASLWALMGFGLALALSVVMPVVQATLHNWAVLNGLRTDRMWVLSVFSFVWSVLHAITYVLLLIAVFAGRAKSDSPCPPLPGRQ